MKPHKSNFLKLINYILLISVIVLEGSMKLQAQEPPPRPIRITSTGQNLSFGVFYHGLSGGSVIVDPEGSRTSTGDVGLINIGLAVSAAVFEVHAHPGTIISILNNNPYTLTGTPSGTMLLNITSTNPSSPFVSTSHFNVPIFINVGGTLIVRSTAFNPPGSYTGTFNITLVRE